MSTVSEVGCSGFNRIYFSSALIKSSWLRKRMMSWRKCWIWGRLQFSFCSRSSRTGVGFPFFRFHLCLFLRLNQRVFLYSLVRDTDISFQILKKALFCLQLFPQSPDFVVTPPPFLHCSKDTSTLCGPFRIPSLLPDISQGQCSSSHLKAWSISLTFVPCFLSLPLSAAHFTPGF